MCISYRRKVNSWAIGYTHREHNHPMKPDLFSYTIHRSRRVSYDKAVELATGLRGEVSYRKAKAILKNHDLAMERKDLWKQKLINWAHRKAAKELKIREKYDAELAALNAESSSPVLRALLSPQPNTPQDRFTSQPRQEIPPRLAAPFQGDLF